jgi:phospholipase/lecithinase/hemolysin
MSDHDTNGFDRAMASADSDQPRAKASAASAQGLSKSVAKPSRQVASTDGAPVGRGSGSGGAAKNLDFGATPDSDDKLGSGRATLTQAQNKELQQTVQYINSAKTPKEFEDRLAQANEKFRTLSVYVFNPKAGNVGVYGFPNAEAAAAKFSVIKNKLVKE